MVSFPLVFLNAINGDDQPSIGLDLGEPLAIFTGGARCLQERTVGSKQVEDFTPRDRQGKRSQPLKPRLIDLIKSLMLREPQIPHQNHQIDSRSVNPGSASASAAALR
jgi:hypothetical protein